MRTKIISGDQTGAIALGYRDGMTPAVLDVGAQLLYTSLVRTVFQRMDVRFRPL